MPGKAEMDSDDDCTMALMTLISMKQKLELEKRACKKCKFLDLHSVRHHGLSLWGCRQLKLEFHTCLPAKNRTCSSSIGYCTGTVKIYWYQLKTGIPEMITNPPVF
jgi:hypothetical protein